MEDIVREAREALAVSSEFDRDNRREAMEDLRFVAGFHWTDAARAERGRRPMITINRSGQFLRQVSNPIRQNMPTIKVEPDGDDDSDMAEIANGLFRQIQYNSSASHVYASAVEHMVAAGIGWFRIVTDYKDEESFDQEIMIKRIFNPLSVFPDPSDLEPARSSMGYCLVSEIWPREAFKKKWPGKSQNSIESPPETATNSSGITWGSTDTVRVAEFWKRTEVPITIAKLKTGETVNITDMPKKQLQMLKEMGLIAGTRQSKTHKVTMTLVSGDDILEETYECPCRWIPIIPVIGAEVPLEQGVYRHGLIRFQREPQQLHNYFMSVAAESLGQQPKSPYLATPKQIGKYRSLWDNANTSSTPYLLYEPDKDTPNGQPTRIAPPPLPTGLIQMAQMLADDMKATTGIYDAALGNKSNETSGVAIGARVEQGNQATFHFTDNLEHSLEHAGRIMLDMMPRVYDSQRTLRLMGEDGTETETEINAPSVSYDGQQMISNDMTQMGFKSVRVIMGPSYASKRQEAIQQLTQLIQAMPQLGQIAGDIIARNLDVDGAEEIAKRAKMMLPPGMLQMEQDGGEGGQPAMPPQPPPDPLAEMQQQGQAQAMQFELESAQAKAEQEKAKVEQEKAKAEGAHIDNALKLKKLREPQVEPGQAGF
jgi:hypothetical protein